MSSSAAARVPLAWPDYRSTLTRAPAHPLVPIAPTPTETSGPGAEWRAACAVALTDLSMANGRPALGQRIIVAGRVFDQRARPVPGCLIEVWQANAAGRYIHCLDQWDAPLDPNFTGTGRMVSDAQGRYRFTTIRPGAYPWSNHDNAWRPAHIHFSLVGPSFAARLVTQMYFPDDPLIAIDPIAGAVPEACRDRLVGRFERDLTEPGWALGYRFDIVLAGAAATPFDS